MNYENASVAPIIAQTVYLLVGRGPSFGRVYLDALSLSRALNRRSEQLSGKHFQSVETICHRDFFGLPEKLHPFLEHSVDLTAFYRRGRARRPTAGNGEASAPRFDEA